MNRLSPERRTQILTALVEGNSIRATCRITGAAKGTVLRLLADVGWVCTRFHDEVVRDVAAEKVQCDEIWSFCYCKQKNIPERLKDRTRIGSIWTFTAIDPDSKLVISWHIGRRDERNAYRFMRDLASRLANRVQLTTDGLRSYLYAVSNAFGEDVDYAMLQKLFGRNPEVDTGYSPPVCVGTSAEAIIGDPDPEHVSTSHVERNNLTMRMGMRRFTRLTNGFSKKITNLRLAVALHFVYYNFCRIHQTLKETPAMRARLTDRPMSLEDLVGLVESHSHSN